MRRQPKKTAQELYDALANCGAPDPVVVKFIGGNVEYEIIDFKWTVNSRDVTLIVRRKKSEGAKPTNVE